MDQNLQGTKPNQGRDPTVPISDARCKDGLKRIFEVSRMFVWGLLFAALFGDVLLQKRFPHSHWQIPLILALLTAMTLGLFRRERKHDSGQLLWFALWLTLVPMYFLRAHDWVPIAVGTLLAIYFWAHFKSTGRSYPFVSVGALLSGVASVRLPWPNGQRCLVTFVGAGLVVSIQGIWIIARYLQGDRTADLFGKVAYASQISDRATLNVTHWIFGNIQHIQIFFPDLEQRIQKRYQTEIAQLQGLGFEYMFSDGEAFSLFRLTLLLPAVIVILMLLKREVMAIHDSTKILIAYPVFISRAKTTFVHPNVFGVKFFTSFQDGTLLVSKNYGDEGGVGRNVIANPCGGASIKDTWSAHQKRIEEMERSGKLASARAGHQAYAELSHQETAAW